MLKISESQIESLELVVREAEIDELVVFAREHVLDEASAMSEEALSARVRKLVDLAHGWGADHPATVQRVVALGVALEPSLFDENDEVVRGFQESRHHIDEAVFEFYDDLCDGLERAYGGD